jgi:hypothetical protein
MDRERARHNMLEVDLCRQDTASASLAAYWNNTARISPMLLSHNASDSPMRSSPRPLEKAFHTDQ